jgi:hypothetical protein
LIFLAALTLPHTEIEAQRKQLFSGKMPEALSLEAALKKDSSHLALDAYSVAKHYCFG